MEKTFLINRLKVIKTLGDIGKITTGQGDDYTTGYLLDYNCFNKHYKMIEIDLRKQKALDANPKAIQKINVTGILILRLTFFSYLRSERNYFRFFTRSYYIIVILFCFNVLSI